MGRSIVVMKLICSFGHCECDGLTVDKLSQRRLIADWLDPRDSDCSRMHSKVSSDWLPSYVKAKRPVLEIFKNGWILSGQHLEWQGTDALRNNKSMILFELGFTAIKNGPYLGGSIVNEILKIRQTV